MRQTTPIPNSMFDKHFALLKPSESIIMLVIFRQTIGWINPKTGKRKLKDWISYSQFEKKTGLSRKTISQSIQSLVERKLILVWDSYDNLLLTPESRCGKTKIFYAPFFK